MILWVDAQISPRVSPWIGRRFTVETVHVRDLGLREAEDREIFGRARKAGLVVLTKDEDFVDLVRRLGTPPQVLWLRCGNMSTARLKAILTQTLPDALELLRQGEAVVEISRAEDKHGSQTERSSQPRPRGRGGKRAAPRSGRSG